MCIIAVKEKGYKLNKEYVENCFLYNPDGAGFMFVDNNKVHIEKGFFDVDKYIERLEEIWESKKLEEKNLVMHFRISTSGGISKETCHPFPISNKLNKLRKTEINCGSGIVHNGIIGKYATEKKMSDTQRFILSDIFNIWRTNNKDILAKEFEGNGKFCILKSNGEIELYGKFLFEEGYIFSNDTYEAPKFYSTSKNYSKSYSYSAWDDSTDCPYDKWDVLDDPSLYFDNFEDYFQAFLVENAPLSQEDFLKKLEGKYPCDNLYLELVSGMYLQTGVNEYLVDEELWLYKVNYGELRITPVFEKVLRAW